MEKERRARGAPKAEPEVFDTGTVGLGLRTTRPYEKGEPITAYGARVVGTQLEGDYVLEVQRNGCPGRGLCYDAEHSWDPTALGRFVNEPRTAREQDIDGAANTVIYVRGPQEGIWFKAKHAIPLAGTELTANYGPAYRRPWFWKAAARRVLAAWGMSEGEDALFRALTSYFKYLDPRERDDPALNEALARATSPTALLNWRTAHQQSAQRILHAWMSRDGWLEQGLSAERARKALKGTLRNLNPTEQRLFDLGLDPRTLVLEWENRK